MNHVVKSLIREQLESRIRGIEFLIAWDQSKSWTDNLKRGLARVKKQLQDLDEPRESVV